MTAYETRVFDKVKSLLDLVDKEIQNATMNILSKEEGIREHCMRLRNKVDIQSEELIEEIRQWNEKMREEINEYEKKCLDKFNAVEFEASAVELKSQLEEMSEQQKKVEELIGDIMRDKEEKIGSHWTITVILGHRHYKETVSKLQVLKQEDLMLTEKKFGDKLLELQKKTRLDPSCLASLTKQSRHDILSWSIDNGMLGIHDDSFQHLVSLRNKLDIMIIRDCFINPYSSSSTELIAIVETKSSVNLLVKMDKTGRILQQQPTKLDQVRQAQTTRDFFIVLDYESSGGCRYHRFDYHLNQLETPNVMQTAGVRMFAVNQRYIVDHYRNDPKYVHLFSYDFASCQTCELPDEYKIVDMLADETFLYIWCRDNKLRIFDIEPKMQKVQHWSMNLVEEKSCDVVTGFRSKLLGDKYIATHDNDSRKVSLFKQDSRLEFVKEFNTTQGANMSKDCSTGFCFYSGCGIIHHYLD